MPNLCPNRLSISININRGGEMELWALRVLALLRDRTRDLLNPIQAMQQVELALELMGPETEV